MITRGTTVLLLVAILTLACSSANPGSQPVGEEAAVSTTPATLEREHYVLQQPLDFTITLTTTSVTGTFGRLDQKHTCEKLDTSPHLRWEGTPDETKSLALIMEDRASDMLGFEIDVLWTHWVVYSIPSDVAELEPGQFDGGVLENGAKQGVNSFQRVQYDGPCPITGLKFPVAISAGRQQTTPNYIPEERPYHFRIYALDTPIDLPPGVGRDTLLKKIDGHILATGELSTGYKSRKSMKCPTTDAKACLAKIEGLRK